MCVSYSEPCNFLYFYEILVRNSNTDTNLANLDKLQRTRLGDGWMGDYQEITELWAGKLKKHPERRHCQKHSPIINENHFDMFIQATELNLKKTVLLNF